MRAATAPGAGQHGLQAACRLLRLLESHVAWEAVSGYEAARPGLLPLVRQRFRGPDPGPGPDEVRRFLRAFAGHVRTPADFELEFGTDPLGWVDLRHIYCICAVFVLYYVRSTFLPY